VLGRDASSFELLGFCLLNTGEMQIRPRPFRGANPPATLPSGQKSKAPRACYFVGLTRLRFGALRLRFGASGAAASASLSMRLNEGVKRGFEPTIPRVGNRGMGKR
jgi:hypothetical protein